MKKRELIPILASKCCQNDWKDSSFTNFFFFLIGCIQSIYINDIL